MGAEYSKGKTMAYSKWLIDWYNNEVITSQKTRDAELKRKVHKPFKDQVIKETQWLDSIVPKSTTIRIGLRIKCVLENITEMPPCKVCNRPVNGIRKGEFNATCGRRECKEERLTTACIEYREEHGHPMHSEEIKERVKNSLKEFFESSDYLDNREWYINRKKRDAIPKERHDHNGQLLIGDEEWYALHPDTLSAAARMNISLVRRGNIDRRMRRWNSKVKMEKRLGEFGHWPMQQGVYSEKQIEFLNDRDKVKELYEKCGSKKEAAKALGISIRGIDSAMKFHDIEPSKSSSTSSYERRLSEILESKGIHHIRNSRDQIGKEIDIYIPSHRIAVEINGLWWHSMYNVKSKEKHQEKALLCLNKGISFFTIWECDVLEEEKGYNDLLDFIEKEESMILPDGSISLDRISIKDFNPDYKVSPPQRHLVLKKMKTMPMIRITDDMEIPKWIEVYDCGSIEKPLK